MYNIKRLRKEIELIIKQEVTSDYEDQQILSYTRMMEAIENSSLFCQGSATEEDIKEWNKIKELFEYVPD